MTTQRVLARPAPPVPDRIARWKLAAGLLLALGAAVVAFLADGHALWGADFEVYHEAGRSVLHGQTPYDFTLHGTMKYIYTPFAAVVFLPLAFLGLSGSIACWTFLSVLSLEAVVWLSLGLAGITSRDRRATLTLVGTAAMLPVVPVFATFWLGQVNLLLLVLLLADLTRAPGRFRGVGVGIAAGIKLTPLIFVPYFLLTRRYRDAKVAVATFLGTVVVGFLVQFGTSAHYWGKSFFATSRMFPTEGSQVWNYSMQGVLRQLPAQGLHAAWVWTVLGAVVGLGGLAVAAWASRRGDEPAGILACGFTGLLVSPVSWGAHWVWCVPLLVLGAARARHAGVWAKLAVVALWVVFTLPLYWNIELFYLRPWIWTSPMPANIGRMLIVTGLLLLVGLAAWLWRADRRAQRPPRESTPVAARAMSRMIVI
jgi:alpha-1,2-mannosyltransferase